MAVDADTSEYRETSAKLKQAPRELRTAFSRRLGKAVRPVLRKVLEGGAAKMPQSGGLAAHVMAAGKVGITRGSWGVTGRLSNKGVALRQIDSSGVVRHPHFGNRAHWSGTRVPGQAFTDVFETYAEPLMSEVAQAFDDVAKQL